MKAYIKNNPMPSLFERDVDHCIKSGYLNTIEVAEIGETLYRKHGGGWVNGTYYEASYEPVAHREVGINKDAWDTTMREFDNLEKENAELKENEINMGDIIEDQEKEIERLKKNAVVWAKREDKAPSHVYGNGRELLVIWDGNECTIPLPPAEKDEADEAEIAWEESETRHLAIACFNYEEIQRLKTNWIKDYRANKNNE